MRLHPMPEFGSFTLLLALALSIYTLVMGGVALWRTRGLSAGVDGGAGRLGETARRAGISSFVALSCAAFALVWASFTNDYSVSYILHHTNRDLNTAYKFSALWSGQEGSLLLWAWLLSAYGFVLRMRHRVDVRLSIDTGGKAQAHLSADQPATLDMLQKDAPTLTRALREAGLDVSQSGLNFSLRGQGSTATSSNCVSPYSVRVPPLELGTVTNAKVGRINWTKGNSENRGTRGMIGLRIT